MILTPITKDDAINGSYDENYVFKPAYSGDPIAQLLLNNYNGYDMPSFTISLDMEPDVVCIDLPKIVEYNELERYKLEYKRVRAFRFYCLHKEAEKPYGNGTKEKPWNNLFTAITKLLPLCAVLCSDYIQLVVLPESDTITFDNNTEYPVQPIYNYAVSTRLIIGSLDNETFFSMQSDDSIDIQSLTVGLISQCNITSKYIAKLSGHQIRLPYIQTSFFRVNFNVSGFSVPYATICCNIELGTCLNAQVNYNDKSVLYDSVVRYNKKMLPQVYSYSNVKFTGVVNSKIYSGEPYCYGMIVYLINSTVDWHGLNYSYSEAYIHNIYNSNVKLKHIRLNDIHTIVDSTLDVWTQMRRGCMRFWGGWSEPLLQGTSLNGLLCNTTIKVTKECGDSSDWTIQVFCMGIGASEFVVSDFDCDITFVKADNYNASDEITGKWSCVFPPGNGFPDGCISYIGKAPTSVWRDC